MVGAGFLVAEYHGDSGVDEFVEIDLLDNVDGLGFVSENMIC